MQFLREELSIGKRAEDQNLRLSNIRGQVTNETVAKKSEKK